MGDDIKIEVIKKTQETLGKFVKKPPLTEKLLRKPPFRFLHDIIKVLHKEYGFFDGIFTDSELKSENVTEKEDKIKFLYKVINTMNLLTNTEIGARPSKIVAGLDPTKTNELLQAIGKALSKNLNTKEIAQQVKENNLDLSKDMKLKTKKEKDETKEKIEKPKKVRDLTPSKKPEKTVKKIESKRTTSTPRQSKEKLKKQKENVDKLEKVDMGKFHLKNSDSLKSSQTRVNLLSKSVKENKIKKQSSKESILSDESLPQEKTEDTTDSKDDLNKPNLIEEEPVETVDVKNRADIDKPIETSEKIEITEAPVETSTNIEKITPKIDNVEPPVEDKKIEQPKENVTNEKHSEKAEKISAPKEKVESKPPSDQEKVTSSTKETPDLKPINEPQQIQPPTRPRTSLRPPSARPISARPAAPRIRDRHDVILPPEKVVPLGKVNVIVENVDKDKQDDENENLVVVETTSNIPEITMPLKTDVENQPQGHLVAQILETQKELLDEAPKAPLEIEWEEDGQRNKEKKKQYIENIRSKIQTISRAALPLGQIVNFLQEDYDNITRELEMWRAEDEKLDEEIAQQKLIADRNLEPLLKQFHEIEEEIQKQTQRNNALKSEIFQNQQKIDQMLNTLI